MWPPPSSSRSRDYCEYEVTPLGDVIAFKKGAKRPRNRVMFDAHMDEVGFIVTYITEEGFLRFATVGGIDNRVIQGKPVVVGKSKVYGIISSKPVHLIDRDHRDDPIKAADLLIDIGCRSREEAEGLVGVGDRVYFDSPFVRFGNGFIKSKALDDRAGCAVLIKMIQSSLEYDTYFSFTTREEVERHGRANGGLYGKTGYRGGSGDHHRCGYRRRGAGKAGLFFGQGPGGLLYGQRNHL